MYVEDKHGEIDGAAARIGWVTFPKTGQSICCRGRTLAKSNGVSGNFRYIESGEETWSPA